MGLAYTERLYKAPSTRFGSNDQVKAEDANSIEDLDTLYSIRGKAPEGWYHAGTERHGDKGSGYQDHQIFKRLPTQEAPKEEPAVEEPVVEEPAPKGFTDPENRTQSKALTDAKERVSNWKSQAQTASSVYNDAKAGEYYQSRFLNQ